MEEEERNNGSETVPVSSPAKRKKHVERRVNFGDTIIKSLRPRNKLYSIVDSKMVGLRLRIEPTGSKIFYYCYKNVFASICQRESSLSVSFAIFKLYQVEN